MQYRVQPITDYTPFGHHDPKPDPFSASWSSTETLLDKEIGHLQRGTRYWAEFVLEIDVEARHIRRDGGLYAKAVAKSHAVRVLFDSKHGPMAYATDRFTNWQANVRAIALGMEALRKVDRYGIGQGAQYAGYKALPGGTDSRASRLTELEAWDVLHEIAGVAPSDDESGRALRRRARAAAHPDRHGGDRTLWDQVEQAATVLGLA